MTINDLNYNGDFPDFTANNVPDLTSPHFRIFHGSTVSAGRWHLIPAVPKISSGTFLR